MTPANARMGQDLTARTQTGVIAKSAVDVQRDEEQAARFQELLEVLKLQLGSDKD